MDFVNIGPIGEGEYLTAGLQPNRYKGKNDPVDAHTHPESDIINLVSDLAAKQPLDATLTSLAAYNTNGLLTQTAADTFTGRTIAGTANRISLTNDNGVSGNPTIDIDTNYVGQTSITTLGTIATGTWNATTISVAKGGTGFAAGYTLGQIIYASASSTLARLSGNTTTTKKFLTQTGDGTNSAAPAWGTIAAADVPGSALTKTDDTNVTLTLGGSPTTALLNAASLTLGWTGQLSVSRGGTGQSSYTDGQLLIGNTTGNTLTKATLTGTSNQVIVTNGGGSITLSLPQSIATSSTPQFAGLGIGAGHNGDTNFPLQVYSSAASSRMKYQTSNANGIAGIQLVGTVASVTSEWYIDNRGGNDTPNNRLGFYYLGSGETVTFATNGNVGLFTTNPGAHLEIYDGGGNTNALLIGAGSSFGYKFGRSGFTGYMEMYGTQSGFNGFIMGGVDNADVLSVYGSNNVVVGHQAALATNATNGFLYIPTQAGAPTGTPTAYTGKVAMTYDTTNNKLYIYNGAWKSVTLA
jgi:hypothetical protein